MERNFNLVREILLAVEAQDFKPSKSITSEGYNDEEINYHLKIMEDAGLIKLNQHSKAFSYIPIVDGITWEGHEFLDSIREAGTWSKVKNVLKEKSLSLSYESIKTAVVFIVKQSLNG